MDSIKIRKRAYIYDHLLSELVNRKTQKMNLKKGIAHTISVTVYAVIDASTFVY